jgi:hypothetical protein
MITLSGRELDYALAEALGWTEIEVRVNQANMPIESLRGISPKTGKREWIPRWHRDMDALTDVLTERGWTVYMDLDTSAYPPGYSGRVLPGGYMSRSEKPTEAMARAVLIALRAGIEDAQS